MEVESNYISNYSLRKQYLEDPYFKDGGLDKLLRLAPFLSLPPYNTEDVFLL